MTKISAQIISLMIASSLGLPLAAQADAISPGICDTGKTYSKEKPDVSFYGTGMAGRMNEAMALRFTGDQNVHEGKYDEAIRKLAKAVQLDPEDPGGHMLYARAMSAKIRYAKGRVSVDLVDRALEEWRLLWHHDSDYSEQFEAKMQVLHLSRLEHTLKRQAKHDAKIAEKAATQLSTSQPGEL